MKKSILSVAVGVVVLCAAAFTGYKVYENHQMSKFSDLMIKNLEALADEEGGEGGSKSCYKTIDTNQHANDPKEPFDVTVCGADGKCSSTISVYWAHDTGSCRE